MQTLSFLKLIGNIFLWLLQAKIHKRNMRDQLDQGSASQHCCYCKHYVDHQRDELCLIVSLIFHKILTWEHAQVQHIVLYHCFLCCGLCAGFSVKKRKGNASYFQQQKRDKLNKQHIDM